MDFIQVGRIVKDKSGRQKVSPEAIRVNDIHSFRTWMRGENDTYEKSEVTLLVMKSGAKITGDKVERDNGDLPTMVIHETFTNFLKRMSGNVIILGDAR